MVTGAAPLLAQGLSGCIFGTTTPPTGNTLNTLSLSNTGIPGGQAQGYPVGIVTNTTSGSTVTISAQSVPNAFQLAYLGGNAWQVQVGTVPVSSSTITFTETLAGKTNSPNTGSPITITETYTNYYVASGPHGGNDGNNGLSTSTPWLTLAKVNTGPPGGYPTASKINFNGGDTFSDNCLVFNGAPGGNVVNGTTIVQSYGTGNATISPGGTGCTGNFSAAMTIEGVNGFTVQNVNITGQTTTEGPGNYSIWYNQTESGTGSVNSQGSVANEFTVNSNGSVAGGHIWKPADDTATTRPIKLWSTSGTLLNSCTTSSEASGPAWVGCNFSSATSVTSGTSYWIVADTPSTYFFSCGSCPRNVQNQLTLVLEGNGPAGAFPTSTFGGSYFTVDPVFDASGTTSEPTTAIGVWVNGVSGTPTQNVSILNNNISNFAQQNTNNTSEIFYTGYSGTINNFNVLGNTLFGLSATSPDTGGITGYGGAGVAYSITNVNWSGNTIYNIGGQPTSNQGGGIEMANVNGAIIEHNLVHHIGGNQTGGTGGSGAFVCYQSNNIVIAYNEAHHIGAITYTGGSDMVGYDTDIDCSNITVEYNLSHDNVGPGYEVYQAHFTSGYSWGNNVFRFNISVNDANGYATGAFSTAFYNAGGTLNVYNNDFVVLSGSSFCIKDNSTSNFSSGSSFVNNQCYTTNAQFVSCCAISPTQGFTWNYNNYYTTTGTPTWVAYPGGVQTAYNSLSAWQTATGEEANSTTVNPSFSSVTDVTCTWTPANLTGPQPCPAGYELLTSSTTKAVGANLLACPVGGSSSTLGATDYFLNSILSICGS